ncbi:hypothetical protein OGAPHI_003142 [Ogataea philodendri]|uniref:CASTOR ACT domain-containing protein n=1 Tax=Ogataea philodendri TaxID=1378263 RepID=A0A9P8P831_9ASCO|nr:uncharacterized protein OGAPHI_003142 [Ogataea philodendri]KAH3667493.1 hypothetical protein OGAPHI_003142 [Ogataea philodendri]
MASSHDIELFRTAVSILTIPRDQFWVFKSGILEILYKLVDKVEGHDESDSESEDEKQLVNSVHSLSIQRNKVGEQDSLDSQDDGLFFHLAFTPEEVTFMSSSALIRKYLAKPLALSKQLQMGATLLDEDFLVLQVLSDGSVIGKKILELTAPLSERKIPIFFISNYLSDIVLIPARHRDDAVDILENGVSSDTSSLEKETFNLFRSSSIKPVLNTAVKLLVTGARPGDLSVVLRRTAEALAKHCTEQTDSKGSFLPYFALTRTPTEDVGLLLPSSESELAKLNYPKAAILGSLQDFFFPLFINLKSLPLDLKGIVAGVASKLLKLGLDEMSYLSLGRSAVVLVPDNFQDTVQHMLEEVN